MKTQRALWNSETNLQTKRRQNKQKDVRTTNEKQDKVKKNKTTPVKLNREKSK